jgi:PGF-pre-PGF domain-containing protein
MKPEIRAVALILVFAVAATVANAESVTEFQLTGYVYELGYTPNTPVAGANISANVTFNTGGSDFYIVTNTTTNSNGYWSIDYNGSVKNESDSTIAAWYGNSNDINTVTLYTDTKIYSTGEFYVDTRPPFVVSGMPWSYSNALSPYIYVVLRDYGSDLQNCGTANMNVNGSDVTPSLTWWPQPGNSYRLGYTPSVPFAEGYTVSVSVGATDCLGLSMPVYNWSFAIDTVLPVTGITPNNTWYAYDFDVTISDSDTGGGGLSTCYYRILSNNTQAYPASGFAVRICNSILTVTVGEGKECDDIGENQCEIEAYATDGAGNSGSLNDAFFNVYWAITTPSEGGGDNTQTGPGPQSTEIPVVVTLAPDVIIVTEEKTIELIPADEPVVFEFQKTDVMAIEIVAKSSLSNVQIGVSKLGSKPAYISEEPAGAVYGYIKINAKNLTDSDIGSVNITFKVDKAWIASASLDAGDVVLNRYKASAWNALPTSKLTGDASNVYYSATSPGLSVFAVTGQKPKAVSATATPTPIPPEDIILPILPPAERIIRNLPEPFNKPPVLAAIAGIALTSLTALYFLRKIWAQK